VTDYRKKLVANPAILKPAATAYFWSKYQALSHRISVIVAEVAEMNGKLPDLLENSKSGMNKVAQLRTKIDRTEARKSEVIRADFDQINTNFFGISDLLYAQVDLGIESRVNSVATKNSMAIHSNPSPISHDSDRQATRLLVAFIIGFLLILSFLAYLFILRVKSWSTEF
jgi:hypothetical protein